MTQKEKLAKQVRNNGVIVLRNRIVHCEDCVYLGIKDFVYGYCKHNMCGIIYPKDYCSQGILKKPNKH